MKLDNKDKQIINLLQHNSRMTASDMATKVDLSTPAVAERIKKLIEFGYIDHFTTKINAKKMGFDLTAFINVDSSSSDHYEEIVISSKAHPSVMECHSVTGEGSHLLKIRVRNSTELEELLSEIQQWPGVIRTHTMLVLSTYKENLNIRLSDEEYRRKNV